MRPVYLLLAVAIFPFVAVCEDGSLERTVEFRDGSLLHLKLADADLNATVRNAKG